MLPFLGSLLFEPVAVHARKAPVLKKTVWASTRDFGVNTFSYDTQMNSPTTVPALKKLGIGYQQFPNSVNWDWTTNESVANPRKPVQPYVNPVSLSDWGHILRQAHQSGMFIFNYDQGPGWKGGGTPADARRLALYIKNHHLPIKAIVIGSEEYGGWDFQWNLNAMGNAASYARRVVGIAKAIRKVLPKVKIGAVYDPATNPYDLTFDQAVLREDTPYINYLSVHLYLEPTADQATQLLTRLPQDIFHTMATIRQDIGANVSFQQAKKLQVWITEFNPETLPSSVSTTPAYGSAMLEGLASWKSVGAQKIVVWSFDGNGFNPQGVNVTSGPYGTFSLTGDGSPPEIPMGHLYPAGQAVAQFMKAIGSGAQIKTWSNSRGYIISVKRNKKNTSFFINKTKKEQTFTYNKNQKITVPPEEVQKIHKNIVSIQNMPRYFASSSERTSIQAIPEIQSTIKSIYPGEWVSLKGKNFGSKQGKGYVSLVQGTVTRGLPEGNSINWGAPADAYKVPIRDWKNNRLIFQVPDSQPNNYPAPAFGSVSIQVVTNGGTVSRILPTTVVSPPQIPATLNRVTETIGSTVVVTGKDFGSQQGAGYIHIQQGNVNWGAPGNWYTISILSWNNKKIIFQIPDGIHNKGNPLSPGKATIQIVNAQNQQSKIMSLQIH